MSGPDPAAVEAFAQALRRSERVLFITGAGISADSGLPTYRGIGGLYERDTTEDGVPIEVALSGQMLARDPRLCWKHIHEIEAACRGAEPNVAHRVIAALERSRETWVLTQNVDGLHRAAGSQRLIEIHGNVHQLACTRCDHRRRVADYSQLAMVPSCPVCTALVRPEVVLFGEMLPEPAVTMLGRELAAGFDLVVSIGTTSTFPYIAGPVLQARARRRTTVEINPGDSEISDFVDLRIRSGAASTMAAVWAMLGEGPLP